MKKLFALFVMAFVLPLTACADNKPISFDELPVPAKTFVKQYFPGVKVSLVTMDRDATDTSYDVHFVDGSSVEFDRKGNWTDVDCNRTKAVPAGIVPAQIAAYVADNYPQEVYIYDISRDKHDRRDAWEISLSNGLDLGFDNNFNLSEIDD